MSNEPKRPPPPDRLYVKPGCYACQFILFAVGCAIVGVGLWACLATPAH